ncbi:MAG: toll/interleukin-1 receptor domain-containing protein, partial [Myxococcota bacterium]
MATLSVFLSHSSADKAFVRRVRVELGRLGIVGWLDESELLGGVSLPQALEAAIDRQALFVPFLSENAVGSDWVRRELETALGHYGNAASKKVFPVWLGDRLSLTQKIEVLRNTWIHSGEVEQLGLQMDST